MLSKIGKDIAKAALTGLLSGLLIMTILLLSGTLFQGLEIRNGWQTARSGLLILGALGLFLVAGSNLIRHGKTELKEKSQWKKHFQVLNYKWVMAIAAMMILGIASAVDYYLYYG